MGNLLVLVDIALQSDHRQNYYHECEPRQRFGAKNMLLKPQENPALMVPNIGADTVRTRFCRN